MGGKERVIHFELLGSFACRSMECERTDGHEPVPKAGRKTLSFLQYLIVNHRRSISSEELIERFWLERSQAPGNALRNMLFKVRALLKQMLPEYEGLLLTLPGCYVWNPDVRLELDTEQFERICLEVGKEPGEEQLKMLLQAISLYKGDLLTANDSEWAVAMRQYYRSLYLDVCRAALPFLCRKEEWTKILEICEQACRVDFSVEDFTAYHMQALIALGQSGQAVERYEAFRTKLFEEYEMLPGSRIEKLYRLASGLQKKKPGIPEIFRMICEADPKQCAFFCTFEMFQSIVALERCHMDRLGSSSTLAVIRLGEKAAPASDVRRLEHILLGQLRAGDPVARLEVGFYVLMLPGADMDYARLVISRIDRAFHKTYRRSKASIDYHLFALPSAEENKIETSAGEKITGC